MTKDDIQLLFAYDRWANNRVLQGVSGLSGEQFTEASHASASPKDTFD